MKKKLIVITLLFLLVIPFVFSQICDPVPTIDIDFDCMDDGWEGANDLNNQTDTDAISDPDEDILNNLQEFQLNCDPNLNDTDADNYTDFREFQFQTDCTDAEDYPTYSLINISLFTPKFGVSRVSTFNFSVETDFLSKCKYTANPDKKYNEIQQPSNFFTSETENEFRYKHSIEELTLDFPDNHEVEVYVLCYSEELDYVNDDYPKEIVLSVDRTRPELESFKAIPNPVIESLRVDLEVKTDDKTLCRFIEQSEFNDDPDDYFEWFDDHPKSEYKKTSTLTLTSSTTPGIEDEKTYKYLVHCQNLAFAYTEDVGNITFKVNLSAPVEITELLPEGVLEGKDAKLEVWTNKDSTCYVGEGYNDLFPQMDAKYHYLEEGNLSEGVKIYPVKCIFDSLENVVDEIRFIVDVTKPSLPEIKAEAESCSVNSLNAWFNSSDSLGIKGYYYRILDTTSSVILNYTFTEDNVRNLTGLNLARGSKYYWEVYAVDDANNEGSARKSTGTTILAETDDLCMENQPPYLNVTPLLTELGIKVSLKCFDPDLGGSCNSIKFRIAEDCNCNNCTFTPYTTSTSILLKNETNLCYKITDNRNLSVENYVEFKFKDCSNADNCCLDEETEICFPNCETITNVDCNADQIDTDNDGIPDTKETECGLDPNDSTDANLDTDSDGLSNKLECLNYGTDITKADSDGDGIDDKTEISKGTDPMNPDDFPVDPNKDSDGDGIPDIKETECGLDPNDPNDANEDYDGDTLTNKRECLNYRTNINKKDSDGDGVNDNVEIDKDTDPNDSSEFPESHILNIILFVFGLGALIGGVVLFAQDNKGKPKSVKIPKQTANKPLVNFNQTKKDMKKEAKQFSQSQTQTSSQMPVNLGKESKLSAIDKEILKKKRLLKLKKMESIFDEFADDTEIAKIKEPKVRARPKLNLTLKPKLGKPVKKEEDTFERLTDISKEGVFEELEVISKKDKKKR